MTYTAASFWVFFAAVYLLYRRLDHSRQNSLLLFASYVFYGSWDYRFLFLILLSTCIDYIGGLGVAGIQLALRKRCLLGLLIVLSALLLCSNISYPMLWTAVSTGQPQLLARAPSHRPADYLVTLGSALLVGSYGVLLPWLYALREDARRKAFLTISMVANLSLLGFFKYYDFFAAGLRTLIAAATSSQAAGHSLGLILPAGISFYTFQAMSYTIDIYRGEVEPTESFRDFALFICFFPHLVAGPIMRASTLLPQVRSERTISQNQMVDGAVLVLIGLFKKVVIADNMAPIVNAVFIPLMHGHFQRLTGMDVLVAVYAFAFQIYGDFSGYSAIARGISKWLGFELIINFRLPYLAIDPSDFWSRWHISLSTWLRDYLYIPLGGNRRGLAITYRNLMITMILGGLWHGASWTFVLWGLYHGIILCGFRALKGRSDSKRPPSPWKQPIQIFLMFHLTCLGWLLFRATNLTALKGAFSLLILHFHVSPLTTYWLATILFYCFPLMLVEHALDGESRIGSLFSLSWLLRTAIVFYILFMLISFPAEKTGAFIYFQF